LVVIFLLDASLPLGASGRHASLIIEMTTSHAPYNTYKFFLWLKHQRLSEVNSPDDVLAAAERFLLSLYCFVAQLWQLLLSRLTTLIDTCDESDGVRSFRNLVYQKMIVCHCSLLAECVCNNLSEASSSYGISNSMIISN
jgi:hypothetical protein